LLGESNSDYGLTKAVCWPLSLSKHIVPASRFINPACLIKRAGHRCQSPCLFRFLSVPGAGVGPACSCSKDRTGCRQPIPESPHQVLTPAGRPYNGHLIAGSRGRYELHPGPCCPGILLRPGRADGRFRQPLRLQGVSPPRSYVFPVRFERTLSRSLAWRLLPLGYENVKINGHSQSRHGVPTSVSCLTGAGSQPCATA
jgi:hypothetical protein